MVWTDRLDDELFDVLPELVELPELDGAVAAVPLAVADEVELVPERLEPAAWVTVAAVESCRAMTPVSPSALVALTTAAILRARAARGLRGAGLRAGMRGCSFMASTVRTPVEETQRAR